MAKKTEQVLNTKTGKMENCTVGAGCRIHAHNLSSLSTEAIDSLAAEVSPKEYYFVFDQNNSGGSMIEPAQNIIVRASSGEEANKKLVEAGGYFDPEFERDCDCCGNRWTPFQNDAISPKYEHMIDEYMIFTTKAKAIASAHTFGKEVPAYIVVE